MDWKVWHDKYDSPNSGIAQRLQVVQELIRVALNNSPTGALRVLSLCSGQGHDLLGVLADHPRRDDVQARLVELDARNTALAGQTAKAHGLHQVEIVTADASLTDQYCGMTPAQLVLICGLFGNITDADIERVVDTCPQLCATGGTVIWTCHRRRPRRVQLICEWFEARGFNLNQLSDEGLEYAVGAHRYSGTPLPLATGQSMFTFVGYDKLQN